MKKSKRRRVFPEIVTHMRMDEAILQLLDDSDPLLRLYTYRAVNEKKYGKAIYKGLSFSRLFD